MQCCCNSNILSCLSVLQEDASNLDRDASNTSISYDYDSDNDQSAATDVDTTSITDAKDVEPNEPVPVRSTKRPLEKSLTFRSSSKKQRDETEEQLLRSSIECMTKATNSMTNSEHAVSDDDIATFGRYIEEELRRMRQGGMEQGIRLAKLKIQEILYNVQLQQPMGQPEQQAGFWPHHQPQQQLQQQHYMLPSSPHYAHLQPATAASWSPHQPGGPGYMSHVLSAMHQSPPTGHGTFTDSLYRP